jgi:hypothetical protein
MKLKLKSIAGKGNLDTERLVIKVLNDADVGDYIVMRTKFNDNETTTHVINTFWFPYKTVAAGDVVVIYSKRGDQKEKTMKDGSKAHFFYWGRAEVQWTASDIGAVLLFAATWEAESADAL